MDDGGNGQTVADMKLADSPPPVPPGKLERSRFYKHFGNAAIDAAYELKLVDGLRERQEALR